MVNAIEIEVMIFGNHTGDNEENSQERAVIHERVNIEDTQYEQDVFKSLLPQVGDIYHGYLVTEVQVFTHVLYEDD